MLHRFTGLLFLGISYFSGKNVLPSFLNPSHIFQFSLNIVSSSKLPPTCMYVHAHTRKMHPFLLCGIIAPFRFCIIAIVTSY